MDFFSLIIAKFPRIKVIFICWEKKFKEYTKKMLNKKGLFLPNDFDQDFVERPEFYLKSFGLAIHQVKYSLSYISSYQFMLIK